MIPNRSLSLSLLGQRFLSVPLLIVVFLTGTTVGAAQEPAMAGHWRLDAERSDSVERASSSALREVRRILTPRGNVPGASPGIAAERAEQVLAPLSPPTRQVRIELDDVEAIFHIDEQPARRYYTDGRAAVIDSNRPDQSIAAWEDGTLYVERTFGGGTRIIEAWSLQGGLLRADFEVRNSLFSEPVHFTLRFERVGP